MDVARAGALTAMALLIAMGCGGTDAPATGANDDGGLPVSGVDGGAPPPPPVSGSAPVAGVFVSSSKGTDDADATMGRPVKTLAKALAIAARKPGAPIVACAETFTEAVKLADGVTMYGYFDCSDLSQWRRVPMHAKIESPTSPAVLAEGLTAAARFEGFDVLAPDVTDVAAAGTVASTSYGMIVRASKNLALAEVVIRGGKGQDGANGVDLGSNSDTGGNSNGVDAAGQEPCLDESANCLLLETAPGRPGGTSQCAVGAPGGAGGRGGDGPFAERASFRAAVGADAYGRPRPETSTTAAGSAPIRADGNKPGSTGRAGAQGEFGRHGTWSVDKSGFIPGNGLAGKDGLPGQGGGGGGGTDSWWASDTATSGPPGSGRHYGVRGGGGGAGGCGGLAGAAGAGGGASVGLFVVDSSDITIASSSLEGKKGGRAGKGAVGTPGTAGGKGGRGKRPGGIYGLAGGDGGPGGPPGLSGHGSAGPSFGLVFTGARPRTDAAADASGGRRHRGGRTRVLTPLSSASGGPRMKLSAEQSPRRAPLMASWSAVRLPGFGRAHLGRVRLRVELHVALRAEARLVGDDLRVHRADVDGARGGSSGARRRLRDDRRFGWSSRVSRCGRRGRGGRSGGIDGADARRRGGCRGRKRDDCRGGDAGLGRGSGGAVARAENDEQGRNRSPHQDHGSSDRRSAGFAADDARAARGLQSAHRFWLDRAGRRRGGRVRHAGDSAACLPKSWQLDAHACFSAARALVRRSKTAACQPKIRRLGEVIELQAVGSVPRRGSCTCRSPRRIGERPDRAEGHARRDLSLRFPSGRRGDRRRARVHDLGMDHAQHARHDAATASHRVPVHVLPEGSRSVARSEAAPSPERSRRASDPEPTHFGGKPFGGHAWIGARKCAVEACNARRSCCGRSSATATRRASH
jgi:hypothetical protein